MMYRVLSSWSKKYEETNLMTIGWGHLTALWLD